MIIGHLTAYYSGEDTRRFTILDFVGAFGSPLLVIAYSKLFWPDPVEFEKMTFLSDAIDCERIGSDTQKKVEKCLNDSWIRQEIEKSFNLFEIPSYFFNKGAADTSDEEDELLADTLAQTWLVRLKRDYPLRDFKVVRVSPDETGGETANRFYQI